MNHLLELILTNAAVPAAIFILGWLIGKYFKPWVHDEKHPGRLETAEEIALIAKRLTTELVNDFPNASWDDWLQKLTVKIIDELDLKEPLARREAIDQLASNELARAVRDVKLRKELIPPPVKT